MDRGVRYPFSRGDRGYFGEADGSDLIEGNVAQILGTIPGERVMLPEFGCKIRTILFDHINAGTLSLVKMYTIDAIKQWESRISLLSVDLTAAEDVSCIILTLRYLYKETGEEKISTFAARREGVDLIGFNGKTTRTL